MPARLSLIHAPLTHAPTLDKLHHSRRCARHKRPSTNPHSQTPARFAPLQFSAIGSGNNRLLQEWEDRNHDLHRRRVRSARSQVDTRAPRTSKLKVNRGKKFQMKVRRPTPPRSLAARLSVPSRLVWDVVLERSGQGVDDGALETPTDTPSPRRRCRSSHTLTHSGPPLSPTFPIPTTLRVERERGEGREGEQPLDP